MATRYCFIDYDRELAIVAELEAQDGTRKLLGVGRLVADPDRQSAEYAVLVADPWQGQRPVRPADRLLPADRAVVGHPQRCTRRRRPTTPA